MDLKSFFESLGFPEKALAKPPQVILNLGLVPERVEGDLVVLFGDRPLLIANYAPGAVRSRERGLLAYARLAYPESPPALALQTNGQEFALVEVSSGKETAFGGPEILPSYEDLKGLPAPAALTPKRKAIEEKILFIHTTGG